MVKDGSRFHIVKKKITIGVTTEDEPAPSREGCGKRPSGSAVAPKDLSGVYVHCDELPDVVWAKRMRFTAR